MPDAVTFIPACAHQPGQWRSAICATALSPQSPLFAQVGGKPTVAWVDALDLTFCTTRKCGTKVELGARCDDKVVLCCDREDEGGHPQATCKSPTAGAPTVCTVSGGPASLAGGCLAAVSVAVQTMPWPAASREQPALQLWHAAYNACSPLMKGSN